MLHANPRYSPVGSNESVNPKLSSTPIRSLPPRRGSCAGVTLAGGATEAAHTSPHVAAIRQPLTHTPPRLGNETLAPQHSVRRSSLAEARGFAGPLVGILEIVMEHTIVPKLEDVRQTVVQEDLVDVAVELEEQSAADGHHAGPPPRGPLVRNQKKEYPHEKGDQPGVEGSRAPAEK